MTSTSDPPFETESPALSYNCVDPGTATSYTLTGPPTAPVGATSIPFVITPKTMPVLQSDGTYLDAGSLTGEITITLSGGLTGTIVKTFTDSADPQTFTIQATTPGTSIVLTPTNNADLPNPDALTCIGRTLTTIDSTWLTNNAQNIDGGPGPWYLETTNGYYRIAADTPVETEGTAFMVLAANVTLDLNGNTITYGNSTPITVANGDFETGDLDVPNVIPSWDVTSASGAVLKPSMVGFWGNQMLEIPNISSKTTFYSSAITIPLANVQYAAVIGCKAPYLTTIDLSVVDALTPTTVLGTNTSRGPNRGFFPPVQFTPTTTNSIKLQIDITPPTGETITAYFDNATLTRSRDHGVVATTSGDMPPHLLTDDFNAYSRYAANVTVLNGTITQGTGKSYKGSAIWIKSLVGGFIDGLSMYVSGTDTYFIYAEYAGNFVVSNNTIVGDVDRVCDRMDVFSAIYFARSFGSLDIHNNEILGRLHIGILISGATVNSQTNYDLLTVTQNYIAQEADYTDAYGLYVGSALNDFEIAYNVMKPTNGRGIIFDGAGGGATAWVINGLLHDNYAESVERPNLEYDYKGLEATALRIRNYSIHLVGMQIYNNTFFAHTGIGLAHGAIGGRISFSNESGQMTNANNIIRDNSFTAILDSIDTNYTSPYESLAWGFGLSGIDTGTGTIIKNNRFVSNHTSLNFGDSDSDHLPNNDVLFLQNTLVKTTEGTSIDYVGIQAGRASNTVDNIRLIDTQTEGGATSTLVMINTDTGAISYGTGWRLTITVNDSENNPVSGATVTILDNASATVYTGTTNTLGQIVDIPVVTAITTISGTTPQGPFDISAETPLSHTASSNNYAVTTNQSLTLTADGVG